MNTFPYFARGLRAFVFISLIPSARDQEDNFDDGNDTGWHGLAAEELSRPPRSSARASTMLPALLMPNAKSFGPSRCASCGQEYLQHLCRWWKSSISMQGGKRPGGLISRIQPNRRGASMPYTFTYKRNKPGWGDQPDHDEAPSISAAPSRSAPAGPGPNSMTSRSRGRLRSRIDDKRILVNIAGGGSGRPTMTLRPGR